VPESYSCLILSSIPYSGPAHLESAAGHSGRRQKTNQHIDPKAIEAAEIRGWNDGAEATRQTMIANSRAISEAVTAMLATPVPFKPSMRRPVPPPIPPAIRMNGGGEPLPKGERACLIAIAQNHNGVRREQLTVLTGYKRSSRDAYVQRLGERGYVSRDGERIVATPAGIATLGEDYQRCQQDQRCANMCLSACPRATVAGPLVKRRS
jgi:hypothetical protein